MPATSVLRWLSATSTAILIPGAMCTAQSSWTLMDGTGASVYRIGSGGSMALTEWDPDGPGPARSLLVVGGEMEFAGATRAAGIAAWDGDSWRSLGGGFAGTSTVRGLLTWRGDLYAFGTFQQDAFVTPARTVVQFAKWDGSNWNTVSPAKPAGTPTGGIVWNDAIVLFSSGNGFPGGTGFGGAVVFDGVNYSRIGSNPAPLNIACATVYNGDLIVGGKALVSSDSTPLGSVARWNGSAWEPLNAPGIVDCTALHVHDGVLHAAGVGAIAAGPSTILAFDGSSWTPVGTPQTGRLTVLGSHRGKLYAGPVYWNGSQIRPASFENGTWQLTPSVGNDPDAWLQGTSYSAFAEFRGELYFAGSFLHAYINGGPYISKNIAKIQNNQVVPIQSLFGAWISDLAVHEGAIQAVGSMHPFGWLNPYGTPSLYKRVGSTWIPDDASLDGENGAERARVLLSRPDGLYLGGRFRSINGVPTDCLARRSAGMWEAVLPPGTIQPFVGSGPHGIFAITEYQGDVVVGGFFANAVSNDGPVSHILRMSQGQVRSMGALPDRVYKLKVYNGTLYALTNTSFQEWNGSAWISRATFNGVPWDFAVHDGMLYITRENGTIVLRTSDWTTVLPVVVTPSLPSYAADVVDGNIVLSVPTYLRDLPNTPLIRRNGTKWSALDPFAEISYFKNSVLSIVETDQEIFAGGLSGIPKDGWFIFNSPVAPYIARYSKDGLPRFEGQPISCVRPSGSNVRLAATCVPGVERRRTLTFQWYRNGVVIDDTVGSPSVQGSKTAFLTIRGVTPDLAGEYQAIATNEFGSIESQPAILSVSCVGDLTGDSLVEDADFSAFVVGYDQLVCTETQSAFGCPGDLNADGFVNDDDFQVFVAAYDELLCP